MTEPVPIVMAFSGNDPTGGAGIQADIEAAASMGVHVAPVITALTVQNTHNVSDFLATQAELVNAQARAVLEDMPVAAFKIGMLGCIENIEIIHDILHDYHDIPVIIDPIISAGGGTILSNEEMALAFSDLLFPLTKIVTPNSNEARLLAPNGDTLDACAQELMDDGCDYVLITGAHEGTTEVINTLYGQHQIIETFRWPRLEQNYHGSGCTLASSIAALVALGETIPNAVTIAQNYTWNALNSGYQLGMGQYHPKRFFWTRGFNNN